MSAEAIRKYGAGQVKITAAAALASGEVIKLDDDRAGVVAGMKGFASGEKAAIDTLGVFDLASASGTTFSAGDYVYWDVSANLAIAAGSEVAGDFLTGTAVKAKVSGETVVTVDLNATKGVVAT